MANQTHGLTVLSFGAGQDSTALLYRYVYDVKFRNKYAPDDFMVIFSDTGDEHPSTYKHLKDIQVFCRLHDIEFYHLKPEMGFHYEMWKDLRHYYNTKKTVGSKIFRKSCTDKLKIIPIYKFLNAYLAEKFGLPNKNNKDKKAISMFAEKYGKIRIMIGFTQGEESRRSDPSKWTEVWRKTSIEMSYPLIDLGMDRQACQDYIASVGHKVPYPSNCMLCPFMSEIELLWLYRNYPKDYEDWVRIEANKIKHWKHLGKKNMGVWRNKLLPEVLEDAKKKYGHMTDKELDEYKMSHGHCVKSKY